MKNKIRIIALLLSFITIFTCCTVFSSAEEPLNLVVLGDSIAEGYGILNSDEACYAKIVADTNGYNYKNFARVANDTQDLLYLLKNSTNVRNAVANADILNICIGSNNYLANDDVVMITIGAIFRVNAKQLDEIAEEIYTDYNSIYDIIRELNPDATIIFNNIYCAWKGLGHIPFSQAVDRINAKLYAFQKEHSDIEILDTDSVITHNSELIAEDCVHPNAKGNIALAKKMLELLKNLGISENTEPVVKINGIDYNFYAENFGNFFGTVIGAIVKFLTWNY